MLSCLYILFFIFTLQWQSLAVATETIYLQNLKYVLYNPFMEEQGVPTSDLNSFNSLIGMHFFKCHEFISLLSKWSNKDWIYLLSETRAPNTKLKLDKVSETGHFKQWMPGYDNEGELIPPSGSGNQALQRPQLIASKASLDHSIHREVKSRWNPTNSQS